ncbi:MAG: NupC/NupG family nucleoside CNT transporter [Bacteroidetes bacterium]|nr:NupC/NupG family nucleoside CNT transporter [Bacteroidota bacterium]
MEILRGIIGLGFIVLIGYLISWNKGSVPWRTVIIGIILQIFLGLAIFKVGFINQGFGWLSSQFVAFLDFARQGAVFLFGGLSINSFNDPNAGHSLGFLFAFQALPTVIFFSAVTSGLYYLGILQKIVYGFAWIMVRTMKLSGAECLSASANIFMGQTEAPLLVKPFIKNMTRSELFCLMTGGMATLAGSVLAVYVGMLGGADPAGRQTFATYLLCASIMNAPAAIVMSKLILPESEPEKIDSSLVVNKEQLGVNLIDALAGGVSDGVKLALNIGGMLLAFIAMILALNWMLNGVGGIFGINEIITASTGGVYSGLSLEYLLGQLFRVFAFMMGIDWSESLQVGSLLGKKMVLNEFLAYADLSAYKAKGFLGEKAVLISTFALCGFANFSSIAIQIGGIGGLAEVRKGDLSRLGMRAMLAAFLATMMTATIAGALF